jgi:ABC-type sugar transport system substrate-binding protein
MDHEDTRAKAAGSRRLRRALGAATVAVGAMATAGAAVGTAGAARTRPETRHSSALSAATLKMLAAKVAKAEAQPTFTVPGPPVRDVASLRGKKVMVIPGTTHIPTCVQIADAAAQLASAVGMKPTIFQTSSGSQGWTTGIEDAIHQHYAAVMLECALDPSLIAPAIAQAQKAGVRVTAYGPTPAEYKKTDLSAGDADPYFQDLAISADQAIVQHQGKPFNALVIESQDSPSNPIQLAGMQSQINKYCPACTMSYVNVNIANWATAFASTTTAQLISHPKVNTIFAFYSGELPFLLSGIEAAHRTANIKSYGTFGGGNPDLELQVEGVGKNIIMGDIFGDPTWTGYELFYQTALVLEHQTPKPLNGFYTPNRLATPQNAASIIKTGGFGTAFVNGYRQLFGLKPLQGQALVAASLAQA